MAGKVKTPGTLSLGGLSNALDTQIGITQQRIAKQTENHEVRAVATERAAREAAAVTRNAVSSADATRKDQLNTYSSMDETLSIAQDAMKLSDSGNPLDRLQLWMMQQSDSRYTAEGSTRRLQYLQGASSALASREVINQQAFQDEIALIQSDLGLATISSDNELAALTMMEEQGKTLIDAHVNKTATLAGQLQNQNAMQAGALVNLDIDQTRAAQQAAANSPSGTTNVGGIEISASLINDRIVDLEQREQVIATNKANMIDLKLNDYTLEQTQMLLTEAQGSKDGFVDMGGVRISTARLTDRLQNLQSKDMSVQAQFMAHTEAVKSLADKEATKFLQTLSIPELDQIMANNGKVDQLGGKQVDLPIIAAMRDQKAAIQSNAINGQVVQQTMTDPVASAAEFSTYLNQAKEYLPAGSPVMAVITQGQTIAKVAAGFAANGAKAAPGSAEFEAMVNGQQAIQQQRLTVEAAIDAEAVRLSGGDKYREQALQSSLRGKAVPESVVVEAISDRMAKKRPITDWLSGPANGVFTTTYNAIRAGAMTDPALMSLTPTELATYATQQALEATKTQISGAMTQEMMTMQLMPEMGGINHPLAAHITPQKFNSLVAMAEQNANKKFQEVTGASAEDMANWIKNGNNPELNQTQTAGLLIELDKIKPGLGKAYVDWWSSPQMQEFGQKYATVKTADAAQQGFTASVEAGLVLPGIKADMSAYGGLLQDSQMRMVSNQLAEQHTNYVTFGGDVGSKQAFLLETDKTLTPSQKADFMTKIINPIVAEATAAGRGPEEITMAIEQGIRTMRPEDPATRTLLATVLKNRDQSLSILDNFIQAQNIRQAQIISPIAYLMDRAMVSINGDPVTQQARGYEWYQKP